MGEKIQLRAADGFTLGAYKAAPNGKPKGGIVVIQEIFGVNKHIRKVADGFAADGYLAIAPALYDRISPSVETGYTPEDIQKGIGFRQKAAERPRRDRLVPGGVRGRARHGPEGPHRSRRAAARQQSRSGLGGRQERPAGCPGRSAPPGNAWDTCRPNANSAGSVR